MRFVTTLILVGLVVGAPLASVARGGPLDSAEALQPDIYPSKVAAAAGLMRRVVDALHGSPHFVERDSTILIDARTLCADGCQAMAQVARDELPAARVLVASPSKLSAATSPASVITIAVRTSAEDPQGVRGTIALHVTGSDRGERAFTTKFVEKPWAADFKNFAVGDVKRTWILAAAQEYASSESQALALAREDATRALWPLVRDQINHRTGGRRGRIVVTEPFVRSRVEAMLRQEKYVEDRFVQRLDGRHGQVWQASLLIDAAPKHIDAMAAHVAQAARAQFEAQATTWGSVAGFLAVIVLLYLLINALTKGYFLWRLRAAALLLSIVGILIVLAAA